MEGEKLRLRGNYILGHHFPVIEKNVNKRTTKVLERTEQCNKLTAKH